MKTEVWTVPDFVARRESIRVEGGISPVVKTALLNATIIGIYLSFANDHAFAAPDGPVSKAFDKKIWPLLLDVGKPLSKTMMAIGIYKCIRNDVDKGWKMTWRSGVGLCGLYLIDGAIKIISGVGDDLMTNG